MHLLLKWSLAVTSGLASLALLAASIGTGVTADLAVAAPISLPAPALVDRPTSEVDRAAERAALLTPSSTEVSARRASLTDTSRAIKKRTAKLQAEFEAKVRELGYLPGTSDPREIARQMMMNKFGWGDAQFQCYNSIIMRESMWRWNADNPYSSAYGIPQALPGSKMASAGADWKTNPATQIKWGLGYVKARYGTPCAAWSFKRGHGWY